MVSKSSETANHTGEPGLRRTIGFFDVTASRTGAARVPRVHQEYRHANPFGFISHESAKLVERPTMQGCPLCTTNRNPLADTAQVFQGNRLICVFRFGNQFLANAGENFGGALTNKCTWSDITSTANISKPYCVAISANSSFNLASTGPTKTLFR